jgi:hypothetical protein
MIKAANIKGNEDDPCIVLNSRACWPMLRSIRSVLGSFEVEIIGDLNHVD